MAEDPATPPSPREQAPVAAGDGVAAGTLDPVHPLPPSVPLVTDPQFYALLRKRLDDDIREHSPTLDAWCFNGGTLLTLAMMSAAALFSSKTFGPDSTWVGAVLSATAGVLVAAERALAFGARWRFHHEMRNGYRSLLDMVDFATLLPEGPEKQKYVKDIWTALYALRSRESSIPGSGSAPQ